MGDQIADIGLTISYVLLAVAGAAILFAMVRSSIINPKSLVAGGAVGILYLAYKIAKAMASSEVTPKFASKGIDEDLSQMVGGMINIMWIMLIFGVASIAFYYIKSFVANLSK